MNISLFQKQSIVEIRKIKHEKNIWNYEPESSKYKVLYSFQNPSTKTSPSKKHPTKTSINSGHSKH